MGFVHRGVIEGFYGPPWTHAERLAAVEWLGAHGLNQYVYAPKDDALHRAEWRTPYPADRMAEFEQLVAAGDAAGVRVGFALSPGLSIEYGSAQDRGRLAAKLGAFAALGARFFALAVDDVPTRLQHERDRSAFPHLAAAHVALAHELRATLPDDASFALVPTDYLGVEPTDYLEHLGSELEPGVEVAWTGRTVLSPTILAGEAAVRAKTLGRRLLLWDNVPVNDGPMRGMLHLGPYRGRDPELERHCSGALLNPMLQARASRVALHSAAAFLADPTGYDPEHAFADAIREVGAGAEHAFRLFAEAHRFSALEDRGDRALDLAIDALDGALSADADPKPALRDLRSALEARAGLAERLAELDDTSLRAEIEPWIESHGEETSRMSAALDLLETHSSGAHALDTSLAFFRFESRLLRPVPATTSYGPRRALYPQLVSMREEEAGFGADPVLQLDRCPTDRLVRLAETSALRRLARPVR